MANIFLSIFSCFGMFFVFIHKNLYFYFQIPRYNSGEVQMLGISHSGIRLIKRCRTKTTIDTLHIVETFTFDTIQQISSIRNGSTIDLHLKKQRITIHSHRVLFKKGKKINTY